MIKLKAPEIDSRDLLKDCIHNLNKESEKQLIESNVEKIVEFYHQYSIHANCNKLHKLEDGQLINKEVEELIKKLYTNKLSKRKEKARRYYDEIINYKINKELDLPIKFNDEIKVCPICHTSEVNNLDHYLPKAKYPIQSLNPINLLPICSKCNTNKIDYTSTCEGENLIHLYFDDLDQITWLKTKIDNCNPLSVTYFVDKTAFNNPILYRRVKKTFEIYKIGKTYEMLAIQEIRNQIKNIVEYSKSSDKDDFNDYLISSVKSYTNKNSWKYALYYELSLNDIIYNYFKAL